MGAAGGRAARVSHALSAPLPSSSRLRLTSPASARLALGAPVPPRVAAGRVDARLLGVGRNRWGGRRARVATRPSRATLSPAHCVFLGEHHSSTMDATNLELAAGLVSRSYVLQGAENGLGQVSSLSAGPVLPPHRGKGSASRPASPPPPLRILYSPSPSPRPSLPCLAPPGAPQTPAPARPHPVAAPAPPRRAPPPDRAPQRAKRVRALLSHRRLPEKGWPDACVESFLADLAAMDSNNFPPPTAAVGEREGRVASALVRRRHFGLAHGVGRSGDLSAEQPKAAGSSLLGRLADLLAADALRLAGLPDASGCRVVPAATGVALVFCLLALRRSRGDEATRVVWSRVDQRSGPKAVAAAGLRLEAVDVVPSADPDAPDELTTDVEGVARAMLDPTRGGPATVLCVLTTSSCFAPRGCDDLEAGPPARPLVRPPPRPPDPSSARPAPPSAPPAPPAPSPRPLRRSAPSAPPRSPSRGSPARTASPISSTTPTA